MRGSTQWPERLARVAAALLLLFVVLRLPSMARLAGSNFLNPSKWVSNWPIRIVVGALVVGVALVLSWSIARMRRVAAEFRVIPFVLGAVGSGAVCMLAAHASGIHLGWFATRLVLIVPGIAASTLILLRARNVGRGAGTGEAAPAAPSGAVGWRLPIVVAQVAVVALFLAWLGNSFLWSCCQKGPAHGDAVSFWWTSLDALGRLGFSDYLGSFTNSNYTPGYPIVGTIMLGWLPPCLLASGQPVVPFLFGLMLCGVLFHASARDCRRPGFLAVAAAFAFALLMQHVWIFEMSFHLWYGESLAILLVVALFFSFDRFFTNSEALDLSSAPRGRLWGNVAAFQLFGLGALAQLGKPPLSMLLIPAVIPAAAAVGLLTVPRSRRARFALALAALLAGALTARTLWGVALSGTGKGNVYVFPFRALLDLHLDGGARSAVPYFLVDYKTVWIAFVCTATIAMVTDSRRFALPLVVSLGLAASVMVIYLTVWHDKEYGSAARYLLHGMYGWVLFYLGAEGQNLVRRAEPVWQAVVGAARRQAREPLRPSKGASRC